MKFELIKDAEIVTDAIKATPPITVTGVGMAGIDLNFWIQAGTLIYIGLLIVEKVWTLYKRKKQKDESTK